MRKNNYCPPNGWWAISAQLDLYYETLPEKVRAMPRKPGASFTFYKDDAVRYPWVAHNEGNVSYLIVDVDRRVSPFDLYDAHLPEANFLAVNRESGHGQYFWRLHTPVYSWPSQRNSRAYGYYEAIETQFVGKLKGDPGFAGHMAKNPLHKQWEIVELREDPYELGELAEWSLYGKTGKSSKAAISDDPAGRNCSLFDELRQWAYTRHSEASQASYEAWREQVITRSAALNTGFQNPLPASEVRSVAKSVARFVYFRYQPGSGDQKKRGRDSEIIQSSMSVPERQRVSAERTNAAQRSATETKIKWAVSQLIGSGKRVTKSSVADLAGVDRKTVRRFKHLLPE